MHELSIAMDLVDAVREELPRLGIGVSIRRVHVRIGARAGVVPDALISAFDLAAAGSPFAGARLEIEHADGRELELAALEVDDGPADR